jgi:hypothetical protein
MRLSRKSRPGGPGAGIYGIGEDPEWTPLSLPRVAEHRPWAGLPDTARRFEPSFLLVASAALSAPTRCGRALAGRHVYITAVVPVCIQHPLWSSIKTAVALDLLTLAFGLPAMPLLVEIDRARLLQYSASCRR